MISRTDQICSPEKAIVNRHFVFPGVFILAWFLVPETAHAYLDPGTGSMMVQVALAGFAGLSVGFRMLLNRFLVRKPDAGQLAKSQDSKK